MSAELVKCAVAANRDVPDCPPSPFQDCRDEVHISVFFDGTGNNKDADVQEKKWSNVARLFESAYRAAQLSKAGKVHAIYISGVGTKFNGDAAGWLGSANIWVEDNIGGGGAGYGGDRRMELGSDLVNDYLRSVMISNAKRLDSTLAKYASDNGDKSFNDLNFVLSKYRLIRSINISVFGFSRGAALARAFVNRILAKCTERDGALAYSGYPLRVSFMGLFDTVASFGVPSQNARTPFTERELIVSPMVERCVHFVAAHELRFSFPVDLIRKDGKLAGNWIEKVFPGVHSDVGGGYAPMEQGIDSNYARIPLREMLKEALFAGVRVIGYEDLKRRQAQFFRERFECLEETEAAYSRYMAACSAVGGTVEQQIRAHMKMYYSANGTMYRKKIESARDRSLKTSRMKSLLGPRGMAAEVAACRNVSKNIKLVRFGGTSSKSFAQYVNIRDWQLAAWDLTSPGGVTEFVSHYIHDSKVDFLLNAEPFSYFSARGVGESSISVWQESGNWLRAKGRAIGNTVAAGLESGEKKLREIGDATSKAASEAADTVQQKVGQAADFASSKAKESAQATSRAYTAVVDAAHHTIATGKQTMDELEDNGERIYESGTNWIRQKFE
ncbi:hypothetical protein SRABI118_03900 [Massilia sp. Bi118]|uniref:T6SS phospholipase effector Tle1-like catalytic domain-containing protein n=1 Tax=Massilia sp. Bi118 TaxID=2822346 RepID=UPI001D8FDCB2|nr:DUF2235 domain-containing protein [Massilia sp. Bi118]CAH0285037.1 hypothetical protein SRABI118_03900 [Massilia sp. Bi118]